MKNSKSGSILGISFSELLFVVFLILKLCGKIDWSWWWVTSPLWIGAALVVLIIIIVVLINLFAN